MLLFVVVSVVVVALFVVAIANKDYVVILYLISLLSLMLEDSTEGIPEFILHIL